MTQNQIAYANHVETVRHDKVVEQETYRNNVAVLNETNRHNVVNENETMRHNLATEQELHRHDMSTEGIQDRNVRGSIEHWLRMDAETQRANQMKEALQAAGLWETHRSNRANESVAQSNAQSNYLNALVNQFNASVNQYNAETGRINAETAQANLDISRYNAQNERVKAQAAKTNAEASIINANSTANRTTVQNTVDLSLLPYNKEQKQAQVELNREQTLTEPNKRQTNLINATSNIIDSTSKVISTIGSLSQNVSVGLAK